MASRKKFLQNKEKHEGTDHAFVSNYVMIEPVDGLDLAIEQRHGGVGGTRLLEYDLL